MLKMKSLFKYILLFTAIPLLAGLSACDNEVCKEDMYTSMNISLYNRSVPSQNFLLIDTFSLYRVKDGKLLPTEYTDTAGVYSFNLSLDPSSTTSRYFLKSPYMHDTIVIKHINSYEFVSAECGARIVSYVDTVYFAGGHVEDSISITNHFVNGAYDAQNVKIYME